MPGIASRPLAAAQARRNLRRVCAALAADGRATPAARAAAADPRALERLVRSAFRHSARYYLEVARTPCLTPPEIERRLVLETPEIIAEAFGLGRPVIFVGLHFGAIELPALFLASRVGGAVAPMETVDDEGLQDFFVRTRGAAGVRIVGLREARRELLNALRDGTSVGLVGDRDLTGGGLPIPLFGAPANLPLGPAMLAVESGAPLYVVGVRRTGVAQYRGGLEAVPVPADGHPPRTGHRHDDGARARRSNGPWPRRPSSGGRSSSPSGPTWRRRMPDLEEGRSRADLHIHTVASDGTATVSAILDHVELHTDLAVIGIADHERIDAAVAARAIARDRGLRFEVVVGEEVTTLGGHLLAVYIDRPIRPYRSLRATIAAVHEAGGLAIPAHPLVPYPLCAQGWVLRRLLDDPDPAVRPDALETFNPTTLGRPAHRRVTEFADARGLAHVGNSDAHALAAIASGWTTFPGHDAADLRRAIEAGTTEHGGTFHPTIGQLGTFGQQLRKRGRDARDELGGRLRRDGTGRDHGYPGGRLRPPRFEQAGPEERQRS